MTRDEKKAEIEKIQEKAKIYAKRLIKVTSVKVSDDKVLKRLDLVVRLISAIRWCEVELHKVQSIPTGVRFEKGGLASIPRAGWDKAFSKMTDEEKNLNE